MASAGGSNKNIPRLQEFKPEFTHPDLSMPKIPDIPGISKLQGGIDPKILPDKLSNLKVPKVPEPFGRIGGHKNLGEKDLNIGDKLKIPELPGIPEFSKLLDISSIPGLSKLRKGLQDSKLGKKFKAADSKLSGMQDKLQGSKFGRKLKKLDSQKGDHSDDSVHSSDSDSTKKRKKAGKLAKKFGDEIDLDNIDIQIQPPSFLSQLSNFQIIAGITLSLGIAGTILGGMGMFASDVQNSALALLNDAHSWSWDKYSYVIRRGSNGEGTVPFDECTEQCGTDGHDMLEISGENELEGMDPGLSAFDKVSSFWTSASGKTDALGSIGKFNWKKNKSPIPASLWGGSKSKNKKTKHSNTELENKSKASEDKDNPSYKGCTEYKWDEESNLHKLFPIPLIPPKSNVFKLLSSIAPAPCPGQKSCLCKKENDGASAGAVTPFPTQVGIEPVTSTEAPIIKGPTTVEPPQQQTTTEEPPPPPVSVTDPPTTETPKPKPFKCTEVGMFPDEFICNMYHDCAQQGPSYIKDNKMPCGPGTVYCTDLKACGWETDCPCGDRIIQ